MSLFATCEWEDAVSRMIQEPEYLHGEKTNFLRGIRKGED